MKLYEKIDEIRNESKKYSVKISDLRKIDCKFNELKETQTEVTNLILHMLWLEKQIEFLHEYRIEIPIEFVRNFSFSIFVSDGNPFRIGIGLQDWFFDYFRIETSELDLQLFIKMLELLKVRINDRLAFLSQDIDDEEL